MGYSIKRLRQAKKMSQEELSARSGVSRATISKLETDIESIVTTDTLRKIAFALDVSVGELFECN